MVTVEAAAGGGIGGDTNQNSCRRGCGGGIDTTRAAAGEGVRGNRH